MRTLEIQDHYETFLGKNFTELMENQNEYLSSTDKEKTIWNNQSKSIVYVLQETEYRNGETHMYIWKAEGLKHAELIVKDRQGDNFYRERFIIFTTHLQYPYLDSSKNEPRFVLRMQDIIDKRQNDMRANPQTMQTSIETIKEN